MKHLPPIFAARRFQIPKADVPPVVLHFTVEHLAAARDALDAKGIGELAEQIFFTHWWCEFAGYGINVRSREEADGAWHDMTVWKRNGKPFAFSFCSDDHAAVDGLEQRQANAVAQVQLCSNALALYTGRAAEVSVNTLTRNAPSAYSREGDTLRFVRLPDLASAAGLSRQRDYERPAEPSGIRMREHDVRGHWRTYASGVRVWVRPHTRGDPDLGRVTRVIG